uniref:Uncharacterized protein n=2 Tax=Nicotiana TaxID=4085 RepID=A0A1S4A531_TOBAC|nr:PREDICTED: uncharacterized protein LOC107793825 [Nicotiana tabacum]
MELTSPGQQNLLHITHDMFSILEKGSPLASFIRSPFFRGSSMPVVLRSTKTAGLPFIGFPGLLHHPGGPSCGVDLTWPALGKFFPPPMTIQLSYLWKVSGEKYMLQIGVIERAGPPTDGGRTEGAAPTDGDVAGQTGA